MAIVSRGMPETRPCCRAFVKTLGDSVSESGVGACVLDTTCLFNLYDWQRVFISVHEICDSAEKSQTLTLHTTSSRSESSADTSPFPAWAGCLGHRLAESGLQLLNLSIMLIGVQGQRIDRTRNIYVGTFFPWGSPRLTASNGCAAWPSHVLQTRLQESLAQPSISNRSSSSPSPAGVWICGT